MNKLSPILLGLMAALAPFTTHVLLPAFPSISTYMQIHPSQMLMVLSAGYTGLLFGLLFLGPASDTYGRKRILIWGCIFYAMGSMLCAISHSLSSLIFFLFFQSIGSSAILISAYALARDNFSGKALTDVLSSIAVVIMGVPLIAPFVGTALTANERWQNVFYFLAGCGLLTLAFVAANVKKTTRPSGKLTLLRMLEQYQELLKNKLYVKNALCLGLILGAMFSFIGSSSVIYINIFNLSKLTFSYIFAAMGLAIYIANISLKKLKHYFLLPTLQHLAAYYTLTMCLANLIAMTWQPNNWILFSAIMFFLVFGLALSSSTLMSSTLNAIKENIASANSLIQLFRACMGMGAGLSMSLLLKDSVLPVIYQQLIIILVYCLLTIKPPTLTQHLKRFKSSPK